VLIQEEEYLASLPYAGVSRGHDFLSARRALIQEEEYLVSDLTQA
jgi:hypothetical protein